MTPTPELGPSNSKPIQLRRAARWRTFCNLPDLHPVVELVRVPSGVGRPVKTRVGTIGPMSGRTLYLVGGAPRVGKSTLAQQLLAAEGIPWLPTDVVRTILRQVLPELDSVDTDPVDAARLAEVMYPHIEVAAEVCVEEAERFLIEGFELATTYPARLGNAIGGITVRACFLGHSTFSADDLAAYRGPKPQHEAEASRVELNEAAAWIRQRSIQLTQECRTAGLPYVDVGKVGFQAAMKHARRHLLGAPMTGLSTR